MNCYEELLKAKGNMARINYILMKKECYGLELTLEEIGKILGISKERIRQIEQSALRKLRHPEIGKKLKEWTEPVKEDNTLKVREKF